MSTPTSDATTAGQLLHRPAATGPAYCIPRGIVHRFQNTGSETARMVVTFTPAGIEKFLEATLDRAPSTVGEIPDNVEEVGARYAAAAADYGLEFVV